MGQQREVSVIHFDLKNKTKHCNIPKQSSGSQGKSPTIELIPSAGRHSKVLTKFCQKVCHMSRFQFWQDLKTFNHATLIFVGNESVVPCAGMHGSVRLWAGGERRTNIMKRAILAFLDDRQSISRDKRSDSRHQDPPNEKIVLIILFRNTIFWTRGTVFWT